MIGRWFGLAALGTTVRREVVAGVTTFLAMAYIGFVNPAILAEAGMDFGAVFVATCLAAAVGSLSMGLLANLPVGLAPGMGLNAFFTYGLVQGMGVPWQTALGVVFVSGLVFLLLSILPVRAWLIHSMPLPLVRAIAVGIGFFLALIALRNAGVVVDDPATLLRLGNLAQPEPILALAGFTGIVALAQRGVPGAVLIGVLATTALGVAVGAAEWHGLAALPPDPRPVFFELDIRAALAPALLAPVFAFLFVDLFDTAGTLVALAHHGGLADERGRVPRLSRALLADSGATVAGAAFGTSTTTSYVESAAGIEAGGRSGLVAVVVGLLFLACLFFAPLAQSVPAFATAPALLYVACLMVRALADLDWGSPVETAPAVVTALAIPFTFSIADGIGVGFLTYVGVMLASGRGRACPAAAYVVAALFAVKLAVA